MKRSRTLIALAAVLALASCTEGIKTTDRSFEFVPSIAYDAETGDNHLVLELRRGVTEDFTGTFRIGNEGKVRLIEDDGNPFMDGSVFKTDEHRRKHFLLEGIHVGRYAFMMEISNGIYTQTMECTMEVKQERFSFDAAVITDASDRTVLLLTLSEGNETKDYTCSIILDGKSSLTGDSPVEMTFSDHGTWTFTLPYLRPGEHTLSITVNDGTQKQTTQLVYPEPMKYDKLHMDLYKDKDGKFRLEVPSNPYGVRLAGESVLNITGKCTWCEDPPFQTTRRIEKKDTVLIATEGLFVEDLTLNARDSLATEISQKSQEHSIWHRVHVGGQIDPGWEYVVDRYETRYYTIEAESYVINLEVEEIPGMTVVIDNRIGPLNFNGKEMAAGKFEFNVKD